MIIESIAASLFFKYKSKVIQTFVKNDSVRLEGLLIQEDKIHILI
jgi:hypothetical protein